MKPKLHVQVFLSFLSWYIKSFTLLTPFPSPSLCLETGDHYLELTSRATIPPFREVLAYEARYQRMDFIETVLHLFDLYPTPRDIHAMSDRSVLIGINIIKESDWYMNGVSEAKDHLKLLHCDHCGKAEKAFHEFKTCQRCNKVAYCGKTCQKQAWKSHKKTCGKKA